MKSKTVTTCFMAFCYRKGSIIPMERVTDGNQDRCYLEVTLCCDALSSALPWEHFLLCKVLFSHSKRIHC